MRSTAQLLNMFQLLLDADIEGALRFVNSLTPYRFTGVYVFGAELAKSWYLIDRHQAEPDPWLKRIPHAKTYCSIVRAGGGFRVIDALLDPRLIDHPSRAVVRAYFGTRLLSPAGVNIGTLCHFDFGPVDQAGVNEELMESIALLLADKLALDKRLEWSGTIARVVD